MGKQKEKQGQGKRKSEQVRGYKNTKIESGRKRTIKRVQWSKLERYTDTEKNKI